MNYSNEEKKAIEYLKQNSIPILRYDNFGNILSPLYYGTFEKETVLNLIQKQDKIIDKMAEHFVDIIDNDDNASLLPFYNDQENLKDKVIEYFKKEVENENTN